jgi:N-glycosylase/DNA lyase
MDNNFYALDIEDKLPELIKEVRFKNNKSRWLSEAKNCFSWILSKINDPDLSAVEKRRWLVNNIKGFGMKTASHFLRNLGYTELAIIDTHILKFLNLCVYPTTQKTYEKIEDAFKQIAKKQGLTPMELDAYVWKEYSKTPWTEFDW